MACEEGEVTGVTRYYDGSSRYEGNWETFAKHGKGSYNFVSGTHYSGNWSMGRIQSGNDTPCKCEFRNGDSYGGQWANGQMSGQGVYQYSNGDVYTGGWAKS